jgi:hypothetical protein
MMHPYSFKPNVFIRSCLTDRRINPITGCALVYDSVVSASVTVGIAQSCANIRW